MAERRGGAGHAGIADQDIELAVALVQRRPEPGNALEIGEIERDQRRAAAIAADDVVEFLQPTLSSRHRDDMGAGPGQGAGGGMADAARGTGDQSDTGGEGKRHRETYGRILRQNQNSGSRRIDGLY